MTERNTTLSESCLIAFLIQYFTPHLGGSAGKYVEPTLKLGRRKTNLHNQSRSISMAVLEALLITAAVIDLRRYLIVRMLTSNGERTGRSQART
jgi:hypothetical protein